MRLEASPGVTPGLYPSPYPNAHPTHDVDEKRLTFLGHLPEFKGNFEGLGYSEGDSLCLKNRK
jgi:hypothetical protein